MILEWRNSDFVPREKLLGVIFDAGMIQRDDLLFLLGWSDRRLRKEIAKANKREEGLVSHFTTSNHHRVYALTESGVKFAHEMLGIQSKIITMEAQMNHTIGLNAVLMRYIRQYGYDNIRWFSTREAADELFRLRQSENGEIEASIRATFIRPDALIVIPQGLYWVEYDNNTEGSRQLFTKYRRYITNLEKLHESMRSIIWITKNDKRRVMMERLWTGLDDPRIRMKFCVEGEEIFE